MATNIFSAIGEIAKETGLTMASRSKAAFDWYRSEVKNLMTNVSGNELMREQEGNKFIRSRNAGQSVGRLIMFFYDPKLKKELPYYDRWPLVFIIGPKKGANGEPGFLGLNMHYLEPRLRKQLFEALYTTINSKAYNENKRLKISWDIIKNVSQSGLYAPCVKHYLNPYVRSQYLMVNHEHWNQVLYLPNERFERGGKGRNGKFGGAISLTEVWRNSRRIASKAK